MANTMIDERDTMTDRSLDHNRFFPLPKEAESNLAIDVFEQRGNVIAKMALPGMDSDNIEISVDEDTLRISGRRQYEKETRNKDSVTKMIHAESFARVVDLPKTVDASRASAEYKDGTLQVTMPVTDYTKAKPVIVRIDK